MFDPPDLNILTCSELCNVLFVLKLTLMANYPDCPAQHFQAGCVNVVIRASDSKGPKENSGWANVGACIPLVLIMLHTAL